VRSFLGITGHYRRFIKGYATLSRALTNLLKKEGYAWDVEATRSFQALKKALMIAPVLSLPDFNHQFEIETNASNVGIDVVLQQKGHPIAFISKKLGPKGQALSVYERNC